MAKTKLTLSVIVVSWNTKSLLQQCLKSLIENTKDNAFNLEIIVVDNGSEDKSSEMVKSEFSKVKLIQNKENLGFSKANNLGIRQATGKYVMLLNSDTIIKDNALIALADFLEQNEQVGIVGPRLLNNDGSFQANCGRFPLLPVAFVMLFKEHYGGSNFVRCSPEDSQKVDWLMGAAFMARKEVFDTIGGLDENIFMYMEEVEWFFRAKKAGFVSYFLKDVQIIHLGRGSSKSGKTEPILNIYKGLLYFYKKHMGVFQLAILIFMLKIKALLALFLGYIKDDNYLKDTYAQAIKIN